MGWGKERSPPSLLTCLQSLSLLTLDNVKEIRALGQRLQDCKDPLPCSLNPAATSSITPCFPTETVPFPPAGLIPRAVKSHQERRKEMEFCIGKWGEECRSLCARRYLGGATCADTSVG